MLALAARGKRLGAQGAARHGRRRQRGRGRAEQMAAGARGARQVGRRRWARAGLAAGARPRRWARGLGARAGLELCTRCTRHVFCPVRLGIFLSQIFWTLFMNPAHEHCSARIFSKKKFFFLKIFKNKLKSNKI